MPNNRKEKGANPPWESCPRCGGVLSSYGSNRFRTRWKCTKCGTVWTVPKVRKNNDAEY